MLKWFNRHSSSSSSLSSPPPLIPLLSCFPIIMSCAKKIPNEKNGNENFTSSWSPKASSIYTTHNSATSITLPVSLSPTCSHLLFQLFTRRQRIGVKSEAIVEPFKRKKCIESNKSVQFKLALTCSSGVWKVFLKNNFFYSIFVR